MRENLLPRREREKLRQRQDMLAAALELFSENGYHNVSMHEIAGKSEFAIGTLYKFFQNKEELYKALVLEQCEKFEVAIVQAIEEVDGEVEKLRNYVRTKAARFRGNLPFVRLFLAESRGASFNIKAGLDEEVRSRYYSFLQSRIASIFESGIKKERFQAVADPFHLAIALDSMVDAFLLLWLDAPELHPYPEDPDVILNIILERLVSP
jgi:TetR/AcrR family transcriptional regulator